MTRIPVATAADTDHIRILPEQSTNLKASAIKVTGNWHIILSHVYLLVKNLFKWVKRGEADEHFV